MTTKITTAGPVFRPDEPGFDEELSGFQLGVQHRPELVVGATGTADVQAAVRAAAGRGVPLSVQSTGHGRLVADDGGIVVTTNRMAGVTVDPATRTARVEAGARWGDVVEKAAVHGLAPLSGSFPGVGVAGYTLGGGLSLLSRRYGYAADHLRAVDLVTADGELRHVTGGNDPDLLWALRGAGSAFGIATALEIGLVPLRTVYGGRLSFAGDDVPALLDAFRSWSAGLPEATSSSVALMPFPDIPAIPEELRGRYVGTLAVTHAGPAAEGAELVAPMREIGTPLVDTMRELPFTESGTIHNEPAQPHSYTGTNALLTELAPAVGAAAVELGGPTAPVLCVVQIKHMGGAMTREPEFGAAIGHREAGYLFSLVSPAFGGDAASARPVHERLMSAAEPWTLGVLPNLVYGTDRAPLEARSVYGEANLTRLRELKQQRDPANVFPGRVPL
ncbi:FAD-binding oxidoreductase [Pseudonocardia sp. TRM90224]|uniref:FAD-binding oxidoreductase n=1 Tax=Pseudonocardia sp. TRM90224 TaxID=2812678 RepID=UPI001E29AE25|nr:FAD-binding oxidoreductase [Pseudonocardia sp. TRM90224]